MAERIQLLKGDCLELMKTIPDASVDCIITDPPYGTTKCKWDSVIPFDAMWEALNRIVVGGGAIVLFGSEPFSSALRMSNLKNYKYDWIWDKKRTFNFLNSHKQPLRQTERISVFNSKRYYPQGLIPFNKHRKRSEKLPKTTGVFGLDYFQEFTNYPNDILQFSIGKERGFHPTQKPVELMEYLIKTYSKENETILDFTMGSGSTGVAAVNTGRKFIGIERDEEYFTIASKRIQEAEENMKHSLNFGE